MDGAGGCLRHAALLRGLPWSQALQWSIPRWYAWGLLTPFVFWIDKRLHGMQSPVARFALHVPLGIAFTLLSIVLRLVARPLRGAPWPPDIGEFFLDRFYSDLLIYAVIAGVSMSRDYAAQVRQRERQAAELALQTADLERRLVESRLQSLRAQLQPHFLFNALNTISAFTETDPQTARRLMGQLGDLLRASLTHANRPLVTLGEELTFLDDYLAIESARFEGRIAVSVKADDDLLKVMVPSFLFQPLVENAIRHGVAPRVSGGRVDVTADSPRCRVDPARPRRRRRVAGGLAVRTGRGRGPPQRRVETGAPVRPRRPSSRRDERRRRCRRADRSADASAGRVVSAEAAGERRGMNTVRVLIVDDEKPGRERVRRLVSRDARLELVGVCCQRRRSPRNG